ncbi:MAG: phosphotransferase [Agathobacter sp.]|nr:phosphotransferase [Agathobacter sp.]
MYNQTEAILSQYEMEINEVIKGRGAFICNTNKGKKLLLPFRGSKEKGKMLWNFLRELKESGFEVEQIELNKDTEAVTEDEYTQERFLLKDYVEGTEISAAKLEEMKEAVRMLANYHSFSEKMLPAFGFSCSRNLTEHTQIWQRHYRELIKVRNYIRARKKKSEFEQIYMREFEHNRKTAEQSLLLLEKAFDSNVPYVICHGDFNQHNVLRTNGTYRIVHFENAQCNWAMTDLANFLRKMLEKNDWSERVGEELILEYHRYRAIAEVEYGQLFGLLLFPEKFWKVTNHYMNSRKTWISERDIEKLKRVIEQEEKRLKFLDKHWKKQYN